MKWTKVPYSEGGGFYWFASFGDFTSGVSEAPWINSDKPWHAEVYMGLGHTTLTPSKTAREAKEKVRRHALAIANKINRWVDA